MIENGVAEPYSSSSFSVVRSVAGIRKRPGMYIGDVGPRGLGEMLWELVGNSVDEHLAGRCTTISVTLERDGWVTVEDDGRGIPVTQGADGRSLLETALTDLRDSPTLDGHRPHVHLSTIGIGLVLVNALSESTVVETRWKGRRYQVTCAEQEPSPPVDLGPCESSGTRVRFRPDPAIFGAAHFAHGVVATRLEEVAALCKGLDIRFTDERQFRFHAPGGVQALLPPEGHFRRIPERPLTGRLERDGVEAEIALQWATRRCDAGAVRSFANLYETKSGGTHVAGLSRGLRALAVASGMQDPKSAIGPLKRSAFAVIAVRNFEAHFAGPVRQKLTNPEIAPIVRELVERVVQEFARERPAEARAVVERVLLEFGG